MFTLASASLWAILASEPAPNWESMKSGTDSQLWAVRHGADEMENEIAIAAGESDFQRRFNEESRSPPGVFLWRGGVGRIEGSHFGKRVSRRKRVVRTDAAAPVDGLRLAMVVHPESVSGIASIQAKDLCGLSKGRAHQVKQ